MYTLNMIFNVILSAVLLVESAICLPFDSLVFGFNAEASVFETGDDMYTVMWSTTRPGTGFVTYAYDGQAYTVTDTNSGNICTTEKIHSVRIPKAHLDHNTYTYHSQQVGVKRAYTAIKGRTISSEPVAFKGYSGQQAIHALVLSDIHENHFPVDKAVKHFKDEADLLILNGDAVSYMTSSRKLTQTLYYANRYSKGEIPVAYIKGNHESRGEFGTKMADFFKTSTNGLYYTFEYGPISFLGLDSGEDKDDSDWTYSGLVDFTSYIAQETQWLQSLTPNPDAQCTVALTHMPYLENRYGQNWIAPLEALGVDVNISAHKHRLNLDYESGSASFYRILDGGKNDDNEYLATMLTFTPGQMALTCYDDSGTLRGERTYEIAG